MNKFSIVAISFLLFSYLECTGHNFTFVKEDKQAVIVVQNNQDTSLLKAVNDMVSDVKKITGKQIRVLNTLKGISKPYILVGSVTNNSFCKLIKKNGFSETNSLTGKWESYRVESVESDVLVIAGSDVRGTMFGIYDFIEQYLGVDPLYFWSGIEPEKRTELTWESVHIKSDEPTFKYRGWFINDEDLLSEWKDTGGRRNIDYPFYKQVVATEVMEQVVEALVRSRFNMIIPASFLDIDNPAEEELLKIAAKRGVFISQHHIEPLGVSAFAYFNYWKRKNGSKPLFSYYSNKAELMEVWNFYAQKWAKYPNVIWQIGLRGIGDRPMWMADPNVPQTDADFGRIISDAMVTQIAIVQKYDKRIDIPFTTTLWAEGAALFADGYLKIPKNCMTIFSDNSPGWIFTPEFYNTKRDSTRKYGIYYHQQVWGTGPHLAPAVHPTRTYKLIGEAIKSQSNEYAIINVSNIREFIFGIDATGKMLWDYTAFKSNNQLKQWFERRYPTTPLVAQKAYEDYYNIFVEDEVVGVPMLLDGQTRGAGIDNLLKIQQYVSDSTTYRAEQNQNKDCKSQKNSQEEEWAKKHLSAQYLPPITANDYHQKVVKQRELLVKATVSAELLLPLLNDKEFQFYKTDLLANVQMMSGLIKWLDHILRAKQAIDNNDEYLALNHLELAVSYLDDVNRSRVLRTQDKWIDWYKGEKKVDLVWTAKITKDTFIQLKNRLRSIINKIN